MNSHEMNTSELIERLASSELDKALSDEACLPSFPDYVDKLCRDMNETREHIIKRSGINRTYGHQLFNGTRRPARDKVIQLALGFGLDLPQTQQLLKAAQKGTLYPRVRRDAVILYCIIHSIDFCGTQQLLQSFGLELLGDS